MPRLPEPGQDHDNWGTLLNEYLRVAHDRDGTLYSGQTTSTIFVAASNAPDELKQVAHYTCDGIDDHQKINNALKKLTDPASTNTGGQVQLSPGTFYCSGAVKMRPRTSLVGQGRSTVLSATGTWKAYDGTDQGAIIEPDDSGVDRVEVAHLTIDGNRHTSGVDVQGIYFNITDSSRFRITPDTVHRFHNLEIVNTLRHGVHIKGSEMRGNTLSRIRVFGAGNNATTEAHGFYLDAPDLFIEGCEAGGCSGHGFLVQGANHHYSNCKAWYAHLCGWQIEAVRGIYSTCSAQDNRQHGFYISSGPNSLSACHADSNSWDKSAPTAAYDGFHLAWSHYVQLIGCSAYDKNEGNRGRWQRYGFYIHGNSSNHPRYCQVLGSAKENLSGPLGYATSGVELEPTNLIQISGER